MFLPQYPFLTFDDSTGSGLGAGGVSPKGGPVSSPSTAADVLLETGAPIFTEAGGPILHE